MEFGKALVPEPVAFVDVDETLVRDITFLSLFSFDARRRDIDPATTLREFWALRATGTSRAESHRWFYRHWSGREVREVEAVGRDWFAEQAMTADFRNAPVWQRLTGMAARGTRIVLVSGSFDAALKPIAERIGADAVLCTRLAVSGGRYTGEVSETMVGTEKARAITYYADQEGIELSACAAFGDHHSDAAMFDLVGYPVIVGDNDPDLRGYPAERLPG